jgi:hypothetical protein
MDNMIERVATAIACQRVWPELDTANDYDRELARAAIEAMRRPNDDMWRAADHGKAIALIAWPAMIDAALSPSPAPAGERL